MSFTCSCCVCHCFLFTKDTQDMVNGNARTLDSTVLAAICKQPFLYTAHRNYLQRSWQLTATCPLHFLQRYQAFNELPTNVKALGITITSQLAMNLHVNTLLESCGKKLCTAYVYSKHTAWMTTAFKKSSAPSLLPSWHTQVKLAWSTCRRHTQSTIAAFCRHQSVTW